MNYKQVAEQVAARVKPYIGSGQIASYIPSLATVGPRQFCMALYTLDG